MSQQPDEAKKQEILRLLTELSTREQNVITLNLLEKYLSEVTAQGAQKIKELSRCLNWVEGVRAGEQVRVGEIKAQLPKENQEIKMGPEEAAQPEADGADKKPELSAV